MNKEIKYELELDHTDIVKGWNGVKDKEYTSRFFAIKNQAYTLSFNNYEQKVSLLQDGSQPKYLYIESGRHFHSNNNLDVAPISETYSSLDEFLADLENPIPLVKKSLVSEIEKKGAADIPIQRIYC